jgi:Na+/proline symporter/dTDP-glucose pyrophosphorylase
MRLNSLDWFVVAASLIACYAPAAFYIRRSGASTAEFFASGQAAPWWLVGTSMVATTFSTDTPNLVTDFVRSHGVSYNWVWWAFLLTGMATVFFYARLWRRSAVLTDLEFYELRYSGRSAAVVRGFRAVYLGFFFNVAIMSTVTLAAVKISNVMLGWGRVETIVVAGTACVVVAALTGLWGVLATDLVQFALAMAGVTFAAYVALHHPAVGGLHSLLQKTPPRTLSLLPDFSDRNLTLAVLILPLTVQWWSVWYPGAEPGGGSYIAQRILASKNERHALGATLWFNAAHYALRPWPWIIVALASMLVFPTLDDLRRALPHVNPALIGNDLAYPAMLTLLPHGALGLLVASLFAAYRSTIETHLNWGSSYLVIDFYQRFVMPGRTSRHYLWVSRGLTALLMIVCGVFTLALTTASDAFQMLLSIGAGTGLLYLLRWFWWRINAWSEIAAMISSFIIAVALFIARRAGVPISDSVALAASVAFTTIVWVVVTLVTPPTDAATLRRFYELTRPAGPGWNAIRRGTSLPPSPDSFPQMLLGWTAGVAFVYSGLFGAGNLIYGRSSAAAICGIAFLISGTLLVRLVRQMFSDEMPTRRDANASTLQRDRHVTKAVVLARGLGTRMRAADPSVALDPAQAKAAECGYKAMMPLDGARPLLDYVLSSLADAGLRQVCLVVGPEHDAIRSRYLNENTLGRVSVAVVVQPAPNGTADALLAAEAWVGDDEFIVLNGDNYYPAEGLRALREAAGPATLAFDRAALIERSNIPPERIARYALLDSDSDRVLLDVLEKPDDETMARLATSAVSMNVWRFDHEIFHACRDVPPSPRGELELPLAVRYGVKVLGLRIETIPFAGGVLDLSSRADVAAVAARLRDVAVRL